MVVLHAPTRIWLVRDDFKSNNPPYNRNYRADTPLYWHINCLKHCPNDNCQYIRINLRLRVCGLAAPRSQCQQASEIFPRLGLLCWHRSSGAAPILQCLEIQMWLLLVRTPVRPALRDSHFLSNNQQNVRPRPGKHFIISQNVRWNVFVLISSSTDSRHQRRVVLLAPDCWKKVSARVSSIQTHTLHVLMLFMLEFSKNVGRREALKLCPFSHKQGGQFSKGTKCLTVDGDAAGRWLTSAFRHRAWHLWWL